MGRGQDTDIATTRLNRPSHQTFEYLHIPRERLDDLDNSSSVTTDNQRQPQYIAHPDFFDNFVDCKEIIKVLICLTFLVISDILVFGSINRRILELSLADWCLRGREVFPEVEDKD